MGTDMAMARVNGLSLAYETIGPGRPWVITPGGRFTKESPRVRELAVALADQGNGVLIWDRQLRWVRCQLRWAVGIPVQADALAALLEHLGMIRPSSPGVRVAPGSRCSRRLDTAQTPRAWPSGGSAAACSAS